MRKADLKPGQMALTPSGEYLIRTDHNSFVYLASGWEYDMDTFGVEECESVAGGPLTVKLVARVAQRINNR